MLYFYQFVKNPIPRGRSTLMFGRPWWQWIAIAILLYLLVTQPAEVGHIIHGIMAFLGALARGVTTAIHSA